MPDPFFFLFFSFFYGVSSSRLSSQWGAQSADCRFNHRDVLLVLSAFGRPSCCCLPDSRHSCNSDADQSQPGESAKLILFVTATTFSASIIEVHTHHFVAELVSCRRPMINAAIRLKSPPVVDCTRVARRWVAVDHPKGRPLRRIEINV